jgi:hypothetical protein
MATVTYIMPDPFRLNSFNGGAIDFDAATLKIAVVTAGYTPAQNTDDFWDDAQASEVSGTNYTAGGNVCANATVTMDGAGLVTIDADDPATWLQDASGFTNGRRLVLYSDTGTPATSPIFGYSADFGSDLGNLSGDFFAAINAAGFFTSTRPA